MKYSNPDNNSKRVFLITISIIVILFTVLFLTILLFFPIQIRSQELPTNQKWYSKFFIIWPEFLVKQELIERKKLKKYPKSEIQRRFQKQMNAMNVLHSPLYDLWLDNNFETTLNNTNSSPNNGSFFWPVLPNNNQFIMTNKRQAEFVIFPGYSNINIKKGLYLGSGESIKSSIPISNAKRFFVLEILPLATGRIKVSLGQYVWTKTLFESDIHKTKKFFIPVNDSFAQNYKILNISSSFYILNANVTTMTSNGRETIYIPNQKNVWIQNSSSIISQDNHDPLLETTNASQLVERNTTLAKGYNVIVLSSDTFEENPLENETRFSKLMPALYNFSNEALALKPVWDEYDDDHKFDIPLIYKKYGYKTSIFSNAHTMELDNNITSFKWFEKISTAWLTNYDTLLQQAINSKNTTKTEDGLNAVFKQPLETHVTGIQKNTYSAISFYLNQLSSLMNQRTKFFFDENTVLSEKNYSQNLIKAFQKWISDQKQVRFYADITLSLQDPSAHASIQDLIFTLSKTPTFKIQKFHEYLKMRVLDHEFSYILDALQARHITHRTIIIVLFKNKKSPEKSEALIFIPGLKPESKSKQIKTSVNDLMFYQMSVIGIPVENAINFAKTFKNFESQQETTLNFLPETEKKEYNHYNLVIDPHKTNCTPFMWKSMEGRIFDIKANLPFYEISNLNTIQIFPCAFGEKILEIEWKQEAKQRDNLNKSGPQNLTETHTFGYFLSDTQKALTIDLYYGKNLTNRRLFPVNFHHTKEQMENLFLVDKKEIDQTRSFAIKSFEAMQFDQNLTHNTRVAFFVSKM